MLGDVLREAHLVRRDLVGGMSAMVWVPITVFVLGIMALAAVDIMINC